MSPRRLDGWEPSETHTHYDAAGEITGWTVVTREPEWDDRDRAEVEALMLAERLVCPSCGNSVDTAFGDEPLGWLVEKHRCQACKAKTIQERQFMQRHENAKPDRNGALPADGVWFTVRQPDEEGVSNARRTVRPGPPEGQRP